MGNLASLTAAAMLAIGFAGEVLAQNGGGVCPGDYVIVECQLDPEGDFTVFSFSDHEGDVFPSDITGRDCTAALDILYNASETGFILLDATSGSTDRTVYTWISENCGF
jgi:hypothetical protein